MTKNMIDFTLVTAGAVSLVVGLFLGYCIRQWIAKRNYETVEVKAQRRIKKAEEDVKRIVSEASEEASQIVKKARKETDERNFEILSREKILLKRENSLDQRYATQETREKEFSERVERLKVIKENIERAKKEANLRLEEIAGMTQEKAKEELIINVERENSEEILDKIRRIEREGKERFESRAKEILSTAIQRCAVDQTQEITTTIVNIPGDEIKGRIIGKEGRNIKTLEKLTGVEIIIDDTPEAVVISGFDSVRRHIAKIALEKLIKDGRIQPARIEDTVSWAENEITKQIRDAGELAAYEVGVVGLDPKLIQLIGRLKFRTSYGQNVLLHSVEVSLLAGALAAEVGGNTTIAKRAGLLHDIGKALDHQVEGSHTDIGVRVLERFGIEKNVISAVKSHHEEYPYESIEGMLVQAADAISGSRPGARKDNLENYLKRLADLEEIANSFRGVSKSYAIAAGREIRIFVNPDEMDDLQSRNLAKEIAGRIHEELRYPGEIRVIVIREKRVIEYAK